MSFDVENLDFEQTAGLDSDGSNGVTSEGEDT